jgi:Mn2+/Fe2+ NRAMP family transporter
MDLPFQVVLTIQFISSALSLCTLALISAVILILILPNEKSKKKNIKKILKLIIITLGILVLIELFFKFDPFNIVNYDRNTYIREMQKIEIYP